MEKENRDLCKKFLDALDEYMEGNYLGEYDAIKKCYQVKNHYDDLQEELSAEYKKNLAEWKKELVGDRAFARVLNDKISEAWSELAESRAHLNELHASLTRAEADKYEWIQWAIGRELERKKQCEKVLKSAIYKKDFYAGKIKEESKKSIDLDKVKDVSVESIMTTHGERLGNRIRYKCPNHNEKTPSFVWNIKEKYGYCFGCGWHCSTIDLYMKVNDCCFQTAINNLDKM